MIVHDEPDFAQFLAIVARGRGGCCAIGLCAAGVGARRLGRKPSNHS